MDKENKVLDCRSFNELLLPVVVTKEDFFYHAVLLTLVYDSAV